MRCVLCSCGRKIREFFKDLNEIHGFFKAWHCLRQSLTNLTNFQNALNDVAFCSNFSKIWTNSVRSSTFLSSEALLREFFDDSWKLQESLKFLLLHFLLPRSLERCTLCFGTWASYTDLLSIWADSFLVEVSCEDLSRVWWTTLQALWKVCVKILSRSMKLCAIWGSCCSLACVKRLTTVALIPW